jgi:hypothetical protein
MKRVYLLSLLFSLALCCPPSFGEDGGSYDFSDNSGDASHTNEAITGQVHDNMGYNLITTTGTGNSQDATDGGTTVQNYFGKTTKEQVNAAPSSTATTPLSAPGGNYAFRNTSFTYGLNYGFNGNGNGQYKGVSYYRELMNGNVSIPTALPATGTGAVNVNTVN